MAIEKLTDIMGSYKISEKLMEKLISKNLETADGRTVPGVSSLELDAVIYFTTISDSSGRVEEYHPTDLADVLGCSIRATYGIIDNLVKKGIIRMEDTSFCGVKDITVLDNDFSNVTNYTTSKYINTNKEFFNICNESFYSSYKELTLYAKRTLLIILDGYNMNYGYRVAVDTVKERLGIKNRRLVVSYINELQDILGNKCSIKPDRNRHYKFGNIEFLKQNGYMSSNKGIEDNQDTYFKRSLRLFLEKHGILDRENIGINALLNKLFSILYSYAHNNCSVASCMEIIKKAFLDMGIADDYVLAIVKSRFKTKFRKELSPARVTF